MSRHTQGGPKAMYTSSSVPSAYTGNQRAPTAQSLTNTTIVGVLSQQHVNWLFIQKEFLILDYMDQNHQGIQDLIPV